MKQRNDRSAFGALLDQYIEARKPLSLAEIAGRANVPPSTIHSWRNGQTRRIPLVDALRLARVLRIPLDELEAAALSEAGGEPDEGSLRAPRTGAIVAGHAAVPDAVVARRRPRRGSAGSSRQPE